MWLSRKNEYFGNCTNCEVVEGGEGDIWEERRGSRPEDRVDGMCDARSANGAELSGEIETQDVTHATGRDGFPGGREGGGIYKRVREAGVEEMPAEYSTGRRR